MSQKPGRLSERLYRVLIPETKKAVATLENWAALGTLAGMVRPQNQDRLLGGQFTSIDGRMFRMIALSDGMGGLRNGQEAAALTLASFLWFLTSSNGPMDERLQNAAHYANKQVYQAYGQTSGATLSAVVITANGQAIAVNIGDSRVYGYDDQGGLVQISSDDTLAGLASQGIGVDSRHNSNALLQHIGMGEGLEPHVFSMHDLDVFRTFLLTTDGIHWVGNRMIELIAENAADHVQLTRRLLNLAEMTGAHDNASIATISSEAWPVPDSQSSDDTIDMELWTPQARTVLMSERRASPQERADNTPKSVSDPTEGSTSASEYRYPDPSRPLPSPKATSKRVRRGSRPKSKSSEQDALPIPRAELFVDFEPRGKDDD